jgi:multiple antibiotic resistance protein
MDLLKPLIALLAIVNPIGVVPFFLAFTQNFSREQRRAHDAGQRVLGLLVIAVSGWPG